jgi:hypothetical protein
MKIPATINIIFQAEQLTQRLLQLVNQPDKQTKPCQANYEGFDNIP